MRSPIGLEPPEPHSQMASEDLWSETFKLTLSKVIAIDANSHLAILFLLCLTSIADQKIEHHLGDSSFSVVVLSKVCSHFNQCLRLGHILTL